MWPGDFCAPRIFVKATCSVFQSELKVLGKARHTLRVENCPIRGRSTPLGTTGYVDDLSCHLLGAVVCDPQRWQPPTASCPHGANPAWCGPTRSPEGSENLQRPTANADGPKKRSRRKSSAVARRSGASCTRTCRAKMTLGQTWARTMPKQRLQYNRSWRISFGLVRLGRTKMEASQRACLNKLVGRLFAMTRSNWDGEPNERHISNKGLHRNRGIVSIAVEL